VTFESAGPATACRTQEWGRSPGFQGGGEEKSFAGQGSPGVPFAVFASL
jgi:hypothetical protein